MKKSTQDFLQITDAENSLTQVGGAVPVRVESTGGMSGNGVVSAWSRCQHPNYYQDRPCF